MTLTREKLVLVGGGRHFKFMADALSLSREFEVVGVLDANGQPHQTVRNAQGPPLLARKLIVAGYGYLFHQRLCTTKTGTDVGKLERINKVAGRFQVGVQFKTDDTTKTAHLLAGDDIVRMIWQSWIVDSAHSRMLLQKTSHL